MLCIYMRSSAGNTRGLIEATLPAGVQPVGAESSAGNTRGLIEAVILLSCAEPVTVRLPRGNTRGLIEARGMEQNRSLFVRLPRGIPAASLKRDDACPWCVTDEESSAGNTRGLIEA